MTITIGNQGSCSSIIEEFFPCNADASDGSFCVRNLAASGAATFSFRVPNSAQAVLAVELIGYPTAGATGAGKDIDLSSEYGAVGELKNLHAEVDNTTTYTIPAADTLWALDLTTVLSAVAAGDSAGVLVTHNAIGGTNRYLGIRLRYSLP